MTHEATSKPGGSAPITPPAPQEVTLVGGSSKAGAAADHSGQILGGDFRLVRRLGEGGMGQVYLGDQLSLKRRVAVKLLRPELAGNEISRQRFKTEAEAVARLTHANIVQVYHIGEHGGLHFMVLEYVEGWNLRDYLDRKGPPELPVALAIMRQVAAALVRAGEMGIIHRDIKPENILLTRKVEVKVADFGLSRINSEGPNQKNLTQSGTTMGTPLYMSPEQVQCQTLDSRTDIYSFGVTCYHMLAGQPPFTADNSFAIALQHVQNEPLPLHDIRPDLPAELCDIVHKMMAKKPADRYQSAREILKEIKLVADQLTGNPAPATGSTSGSRLNLAAKRWGSRGARRRLWVMAASVIGVALAGVAIGSSLKHGENSRQSDAAFADGETKRQPPQSSPEKEREHDLLRRIEMSRNPPESRAKDRVSEFIWDGVRDRIDLAYLYLYERPSRDLESAAKLFAEMHKSPVSEYQQIGRIGEAIILAFKDSSDQSVQLFQEGNVLGQLPNLRSQLGASHFKNLMRMIRDALYHDRTDFAHRQKTFPNDLKSLENLEPGGKGAGLPGLRGRLQPSKPDGKPASSKE